MWLSWRPMFQKNQLPSSWVLKPQGSLSLLKHNTGLYPEPLESISHSPNSLTLILSPTYNHITPFRFYNCKCELYISLNTTCKEGEEWGACMTAWWRFNQILEGDILQKLACIHSRNLSPFIESKYPFVCSQQLSTGFYSEPHESTPNPLHTLVLSVQFSLLLLLYIFICHSKGFFASGFYDH
jgi:hypothetical protein